MIMYNEHFPLRIALGQKAQENLLHVNKATQSAGIKY